jgi:hypothetical protein
MTNGVCYGVMFGSLVEIYLRFGGGTSTQEREPAGLSEIVVDLYHTTRCHILEDGIAHRRNFKYHIRLPNSHRFLKFKLQ